MDTQSAGSKVPDLSSNTHGYAELLCVEKQEEFRLISIGDKVSRETTPSVLLGVSPGMRACTPNNPG